MALEDSTNLGLMYKIQTSIVAKYVPSIQCGKFIYNQVSHSTYPQK